MVKNASWMAEEYERHKKQMHYSDDLDFDLENVKILVDWINNGRSPFQILMPIFGTNVMLN